MIPGSAVLPFAIPEDIWAANEIGDTWSIYGDGKMIDENGNEIPGNWGTVDIGSENNSTHDLNDQILDGLHQSDLDILYEANRIDQNTHIDATVDMWVNADTGLSVGVKQSVEQIHGEVRFVPIYSQNNGEPGNNLEFHITGWGIVTVVDSNWGDVNWINVQKTYAYLGALTPQPDLSIDAGMEGAFTSPVLVE